MTIDVIIAVVLCVVSYPLSWFVVFTPSIRIRQSRLFFLWSFWLSAGYLLGRLQSARAFLVALVIFVVIGCVEHSAVREVHREFDRLSKAEKKAREDGYLGE